MTEMPTTVPAPAPAPAVGGEVAIAPLSARPEVMAFLETRRSRPAKTLTAEAPPREAIERMIAAAARSPDHGKLEPWRFVVADRAAMAGLEAAAMARAPALGLDAEGAAKAARNFTFGGAIVSVIAAPKPGAKIPEWEQALSAGAVCLALLNAAAAAGWGANWLTGPFAKDPGFLETALGCGPDEYAAGFIHLGRETAVPPDRPRPDLTRIVTWL